MSELVRMEAVDKRFPGVHALKAVDFNLRAGEVHALMGENGAGKSTLMKCLSGVYQPDGGRILIDGAEVALPTPRTAQDLGIGIIHQELALMRDLNVAQNIWIGREPRLSFGRIDEARLNADAQAIFQAMNVAMDPRMPVSGLTIARQQMVEIAKALSYRSRVLIMDEPTAALNDSEIAELFTIIRKLRAEGVGIIYISHKMEGIRQHSARGTVIRDGSYVGMGRVAFANPGTEVELGFGPDDQVRVTFALASRESGQRGLITRVSTCERHYEVTVDTLQHRGLADCLCHQ